MTARRPHAPPRLRSTSATLLGCWGSEEATLARTSRQAIVKCRGFKGYAARSSQIGDGTTTFRNTPTTINVGGAVGLLALGNSLSLTCESDGQHDPQVLGLHDRGGDCGSGSRLQELQITSRSPGARWNIVSTDRVQVRSRVAGRYRDGNFLPAVAPPERLVDLDPRPRAGASAESGARRAPGAAHPPHRAHIARSEPSERQSSRETITSQNSTAVYNEDKTRSNDLAPQTPHPRSPIHAPTRDLTRSRSPSSAHDGTNTSEVTNTCPHAREQHPAPTTTPTHPRSPNRRTPCPPAPLVVFV